MIPHDGYSSLEHLARTVNPISDWRGVQLAMLTAAFDASGHESDQLFLVVAGFISSADDWADFSHRWNERLEKDGIPCFHAAACENNTDEFWGWKKKTKEKIKLKEDLIDIINSYSYRLFSSAVEIETLGKAVTREPHSIWFARLCARW